jgi:hypothetical protein
MRRDYIEVVFSELDAAGTTAVGKYYIGRGVKGEDISLVLPTETTYEAVMFLGVRDGYKLLAVGVPISVDDKYKTDGDNSWTA